jgi:hypothetical protein
MEIESFLCEKGSFFKPNGYNMTLGGDGTYGLRYIPTKKKKPVTEEQKKKMSESRKRYFL